MDNIGMNGNFSFTIEDELIAWFRKYVKEESTTMSAVLNQYVLKLKRETEKQPEKLGTFRMPVGKRVIHS